MESAAFMAGRLREVVLNGTWIANTNYTQELTGLPVETAKAKVGSLNTIADLAQHIHYYLAGILNVLRGGALEIKDKYSFDFPELQSQEQWDAVLQKFFSDAEAIAQLIGTMPEEKLNEVFVDEKYDTYRRNIEGMIEHSYYHLGQIVLLKKLLSV